MRTRTNPIDQSFLRLLYVLILAITSFAETIRVDPAAAQSPAMRRFTNTLAELRELAAILRAQFDGAATTISGEPSNTSRSWAPQTPTRLPGLRSPRIIWSLPHQARATPEPACTLEL